MYEELVQALRHCVFGDCIDCSYRDNCASLNTQAADAIEDLSRLHEAQRQNLIALMNEEPEPKWIPVTERLPDYDEEVLVADFCSLGWCMHVWYRTHDGKGTDYWEAEDGHFVGINYAEYWMPLPEPPKEES